MDKIFKSRGSFDAYIEGSILVTSTKGSWNVEMQRESSLQSAPFVAQLEQAGKPWAVIVQVHETLLSSPEVLMAGRQSVASMAQSSKLVALAWVVDKQVEGYPLVVPRYKEICAGLIKAEFFTSLAEAKAWLSLELAGA